jgi:DNA-binding CsgD family transcriptional regulator
MSSIEAATELADDISALIVEVTDPAVLWPLMLMRLQEAIGFDAGYIGATWGNATEGRGAVAEHDEPFLKRNLGRYLAEITPEEVAQYTDRARVHHDIWSRARQDELAVFREILFPTGMQHMIVRVSVSNGNLAGFNLERRGSTPFTDRELAVVDTMAPFLHIVEVLTLRDRDDAGLEELAHQFKLTEREREFAGLAARGLQNHEIAKLAGNISPNTVRNTLQRVYDKVGVTNRAELASLATRPPTDRDGRTTVAPPPSRQPCDGMQTFALRVAEASARKHATASNRTAALQASGIVYTPPVRRTTI